MAAPARAAAIATSRSSTPVSPIAATYRSTLVRPTWRSHRSRARRTHGTAKFAAHGPTSGGAARRRSALGMLPTPRPGLARLRRPGSAACGRAAGWRRCRPRRASGRSPAPSSSARCCSGSPPWAWSPGSPSRCCSPFHGGVRRRGVGLPPAARWTLVGGHRRRLGGDGVRPGPVPAGRLPVGLAGLRRRRSAGLPRLGAVDRCVRLGPAGGRRSPPGSPWSSRTPTTGSLLVDPSGGGVPADAGRRACSPRRPTAA